MQCAYSALSGQKRAPDALGLELKMFANLRVGAGKETHFFGSDSPFSGDF